MERRPEIMVGAAAAALTAASPMMATPAAAQPIPAAVSYADLLEPVPNAVERLNAANGAARLIPVQYQADGPQAHHHHHHHHHHHSRRWYRANGYIWSGGAWVLRPVNHHHHHHHHHNSNY